MFTGLVETIQPLKSNEPGVGGRRLRIPLGKLEHGAIIGDSICVNGVCLTISRLEADLACFDVSPETIKTSTLSDLKPGELLNLERAIPATGRFGGHFVQGHVDGVGTIAGVEDNSKGYVLWVSTTPEFMSLMIEKGSVAVDGVSLTIGAVQRFRFSVTLIPTTLSETNLRLRKKGDKVNLEADLIAKWINKRLDQVLGASKNTEGGLNLKKLREEGFA